MGHINIDAYFTSASQVNLVEPNAEIDARGYWTGCRCVCHGKRCLCLCRGTWHSPSAGPSPACQEAALPSRTSRSSQEEPVQEKTPRAQPCQGLLIGFCRAVPDGLGCDIVFSDQLFFSFPPAPMCRSLLCHEAKPTKLSCKLLNSLESLKAVLTLCCAVAVVIHGPILSELLLLCKTRDLSRTFF